MQNKDPVQRQRKVDTINSYTYKKHWKHRLATTEAPINNGPINN